MCLVKEIRVWLVAIVNGVTTHSPMLALEA